MFEKEIKGITETTVKVMPGTRFEDKMRKRRKGCIFFLVCLAGLITVVSLVEFLEPPRNKYGVINFENDPRMVDFFTDYRNAIVQGDDWVKDPEKVALRVAGYPNDDNIPPAKVNVEQIQEGKVIITILSRELMDDSIRRQETRVELIKDGEIWKVEWAGSRQQCARSGFWSDWTISPCP